MAERFVDVSILTPVDAAREVRPIALPTSSYLKLKRAADVAASLVLLGLSTPILILAAIMIRLDSPGPAIFKQQRIGRHGRPFTIYKFRTLCSTAAPYSYKVALTDPAVTRVGKWLRKSGLDELPQLINVLKGEMSLIGPRPELPFIVSNFEPWQHARHAIRPGITGWWQIHHRDHSPLHLNLEYDLYYLEHLSARLDFQIAVATAGIIFGGLFSSS